MNTQDTNLRPVIEDFLNGCSEIFERCVNPGKNEGIIGQEFITRLATLITDQNEDQIQQAIRTLPGPARAVCWEIFYFINRCKSSSKYQFYIRKDYYDPEDWDSAELISRRDDILDFVIRRRLNDSRVIFVTATPGDIKLHASSCTMRNYDNVGLKITPSVCLLDPDIDHWFRRLGIIVVDDIDDTRRMNMFEKAMKLVTEILERRDERALVLFKNYRDQRLANDLLAKPSSNNCSMYISIYGQRFERFSCKS